jgi:hypothetical protein
VFAAVEHADDVRMAQGGRQFGLADEPCLELAVAGGVAGQDLDRVVARQPGVPEPVKLFV